MAVILPLIKRLIVDGKHFDPANPSIVICSQQLENIFNMKALDVRQIIPALKKFLIPLADESDNFEPGTESCESGDEIAATECLPTTSRPVQIDPNQTYVMSSELGCLLQPSHPGQLVSFKEASGLLSKYIIQRKDHLFDARNILVALIENDPLGKIFGVKAFHRSQAAALIQKHLHPVKIEVIIEDQIVPEVKRVDSREDLNEQLTGRKTIAELCSPRPEWSNSEDVAITSLKRCSADMDESELPVKKRLMRHAF